MVLEDLGDFAKTVGVELEIRPIGQLVVGGGKPGAHAGRSGALEPGSDGGQLAEAFAEGGVVLAEIDRQARRGPDELLRSEVGERFLQLLRAHPREFLATRFDGFEGVFRREFVQFLLALHGDADASGREGESEFPSSRLGSKGGGRKGGGEGHGRADKMTTVHASSLAGVGPSVNDRACARDLPLVPEPGMFAS